MTAFSGGGRPGGVPNLVRSTVDPAESESAMPRPLDQIFPLHGDANRSGEMQTSWRSFCNDRLTAVRGVLEAGKSPAEIAYQLGELLHNHFRTRGVTLTSFELRRLVAELLTLYGPADKKMAPPPPVPPASVANKAAEAKPQAVVSFGRESPQQPWPGDAPPMRPPTVSDKALEPPPSPIVSVAPKPTAAAPQKGPEPPFAPAREPASFERLIGHEFDLAAGRLASHDQQAALAEVEEVVGSVASEQGDSPAGTRERLDPAALGEVAGLGLIDRLLADDSIGAIFVNGPQSVFVERQGTLQPIEEAFRDEAHLLEEVSQLIGRQPAGAAEFQLRDGSNGFVVFPPAAPAGPVLSLRRAEPGQATLEGLVSRGLVDRPVAELLRLATRNRLNMLVTGPGDAGKTALLAALVRDLDAGLRVVTVAPHRQFQWPTPFKVELVASSATPMATLIAAAGRLEPTLLVLDALQLEDVSALAERLLRGQPGTLAAIGPDVMSVALGRSADLVVRIERAGDGSFSVGVVEDSAGAAIFKHQNGALVRGSAPAFAATLQARGQSEAFAKVLA